MTGYLTYKKAPGGPGGAWYLDTPVRRKNPEKMC